MIYHILNGDALVDRFKETGIEGQVIVMRECLIVGNLKGDTLQDFLRNRADFISNEYNTSRESYFNDVEGQFNELLNAPDGSEFNLWFGYDLFCQANLWFLLSLLHDLSIPKRLYLVYPTYLSRESRWNDFGPASHADLVQCFKERISITQDDLELGNELWNSYKEGNLIKLRKLSESETPCFPYLKEVVDAHIDRFPTDTTKGKPERILEDIIESNIIDFAGVFNAFSKRAGVYGFGDDQLKKLYDKVIKHKGPI